MRKFALLTVGLLLLCLLTLPVYAQAEGGGTTTTMQTHWLAVAMAIAAAGCGIAQSRAIAGGCEGVSRNPGAVDTIRFFVILGLAFIEFLALLTFVVVLYL
ncbi:MAG: ATP synthase F0 subunit C [Acidobacteriota bacterium]|jgi:F-type H+-transporting ATPase subunit c